MNGENDPFVSAAPHQRPEYADEDQELEEALGNIWEIARENHLDPFPTHFEVAPPNIINQIGSYSLPERFSHWSFGKQYRYRKTMYDYGLSKIYELVINSNPSQAFLLENNPPIENKFVMAHVLGHTDFFKNNRMFAPTRRDMPEAAARNALRIRDYEESHGRLAVEKLLDAVLSIENHVDPFNPQRLQKDEELKAWQELAMKKQQPVPKARGEFDEFFDLFDKREAPSKIGKVALTIPPTPDQDLLGFIRNYAPYLEDWQRDVVDIVRSESVYFYPQMRTKIMNEGWAAYWHKRIMREMGDRNLITGEENESWWKLHSGVVAPNPKQLNPYYLGMKMYEYIEDYYNGNLTDKETAWLQKDGTPTYPHYEGELKDSPAAPMLRDVMMFNDDQSFIRNHFNKIVADRMGMYIYEKVNLRTGSYNIVKETGWKEIRDSLAGSMVNCGNPYIVVIDGDYNHANELYLRHEFEGQTLDPDYIQKTLPYIYTLWQRSVHLETIEGDNHKTVIYDYDGENVSKKTV